jgi:hypothetical protein
MHRYESSVARGLSKEDGPRVSYGGEANGERDEEDGDGERDRDGGRRRDRRQERGGDDLAGVSRGPSDFGERPHVASDSAICSAVLLGPSFFIASSSGKGRVD